MFSTKIKIMKIALHAVLWILIVFFSYKIYDSINGPINFNETKNERYADVNFSSQGN